MFQQMTEIALKGLAFLIGSPKGQVIQSRRIGKHLGISPTYVAKALQPFARAGWLQSVKGRAGGWLVTFAPQEHTLLEAVDQLEPGGGWKRCFVGDVVCVSPQCGEAQGRTHEPGCPFNDLWQRTVGQIESILGSTRLDRLPLSLPACFSHAQAPAPVPMPTAMVS